MSYPPPTVFGFPPYFSKWRTGQYESIQRSLASTKRFKVHEAPTGVGKSILAIGEALMLGKRVLILTSTKFLQKQYEEYFGSLLVSVKGQTNYDCIASQTAGQFEKDFLHPVSVDLGPCHFGETCTLKLVGGCTYFDLLTKARASRIVLANYAFWIAQNRYGEGIGDFDLIICDEAHETLNCLSDALAITLNEDETAVVDANLPDTVIPSEWASWAESVIWRMEPELEALTVEGKVRSKLEKRRLSVLKRLHRKLTDTVFINDSWVIEKKETSAQISLIWPQRYSEEYLFAGTPKVLFVSATVRPKTLELLGVPPSETDYFEHQSTFPILRRPIYYIPTIRMKYGNDDDDARVWITRLDQWVSQRLDRKGIVHTGSFARQQQILDTSRFKPVMLYNRQHIQAHTEKIVEKFKTLHPPSILVSPSIDTGVDFPYSLCEYVAIPKVPFLPIDSELFRRRLASDPSYGDYCAIQKIEQMNGRGMRAEDDQCETVIFDSCFGDILRRRKKYFSKSFLDALQVVETLPKPLEKLRK